MELLELICSVVKTIKFNNIVIFKVITYKSCSYALNNFVPGWGPYAHFDALSETHSSPFPVPPVNDIEMHERTPELVTVPLDHSSSSTLNDVEAGRM